VAFNLRKAFFSLDKNYSDAREHWNTEIDIRPRRKENGWKISSLLKTSRKTSIEFSWRENRYDYENLLFDVFNVREQLSRKETHYNFSAYYQITSRTRYLVDLEYGQFRFDFSQAAQIRNSNSEAVYTGIEFSPLGRIRGRIRVGYKKLNVFDLSQNDYSGIVGGTDVSIRVARPFVIRASYTRDVQFSLWYQNAYFIENRPGAGASFYFLRFLRLDYDFSLGRNAYPVAQDAGGGERVKRRDDYTTHTAGLYVRVWKKTAVGFVASYWIRDSNLAAENNKRLFYGINLTYDF